MSCLQIYSTGGDLFQLTENGILLCTVVHELSEDVPNLLRKFALELEKQKDSKFEASHKRNPYDY